MSQILFVREQAYLAGLNSVHESADCLTHVAMLHHPEHGVGRYFVKHYLDGARPSKGLVNEVCGHLLAQAAALSLPDHALIVELPRERVVEMHGAHAAEVRAPRVLVWATADAGGDALPKDSAPANELLRRWRAISDLIAFDSWVVIPDRSSGNLARRSNRQIVVIDHGHLAGSVFWEADMLPTTDEGRHPFLSLWMPGPVPDEINQRIIVAAEGHEACYERARQELNRLIDPLLDNVGDRIALLQFLQERAKSSPTRMKRVLQMLA